MYRLVKSSMTFFLIYSMKFLFPLLLACVCYYLFYLRMNQTCKQPWSGYLYHIFHTSYQMQDNFLCCDFSHSTCNYGYCLRIYLYLGFYCYIPDWVGEIHTAQSQWLDRRQRTRIPNILLLYFILITTLIHGSKNTSL